MAPTFQLLNDVGVNTGEQLPFEFLLSTPASEILAHGRGEDTAVLGTSIQEGQSLRPSLLTSQWVKQRPQPEPGVDNLQRLSPSHQLWPGGTCPPKGSTAFKMVSELGTKCSKCEIQAMTTTIHFQSTVDPAELNLCLH